MYAECVTKFVWEQLQFQSARASLWSWMDVERAVQEKNLQHTKQTACVLI